MSTITEQQITEYWQAWHEPEQPSAPDESEQWDELTTGVLE